MHQQVIDPGVQFGVGLGGVVVQHQAQGSVRAFEELLQRLAAVRCVAQLFGDARAELLQRQRLAGQVEAHAAPLCSGLLQAFPDQGAFAVAGGCAEQAQTRLPGKQFRDQARTRHEPGWLRGSCGCLEAHRLGGLQGDS
ncbi:hypothetical protein D3C78_1016300 [compost metagenome]